MKRLLSFSISLLCLSLTLLIGFHLGGRDALADWDPAAGGPIVGMMDHVAYTAAGEGWILDAVVGEWRRNEAVDLPVPATDVAFAAGFRLITRSGEGWVWDSALTGWKSVGMFPGATSVSPTSWGAIKRDLGKGK